MSHFTVTVVGEDVEEQLQPFHEFECTGTDDQYVVDVDVTDEWEGHKDDYPTLEQFAKEWHGIDGDSKYGRLECDDNGVAVKLIDRTNPNAKWDWWVIGGRWQNYFLHKNGQRCDVLRKGVLDVDGMKAEAIAGAEGRFNSMRRITGGDTWLDWATIRDAHPDDIDEARKRYREQPAIASLQDSEEFKWDWELDKYLAGREDFVFKAGMEAVPTFAFVQNKKWHEKGSMGWWWACVTNEKEYWPDQYMQLLGQLSDDDLLTCVDCHI